jgi:hypothetical protein
VQTFTILCTRYAIFCWTASFSLSAQSCLGPSVLVPSRLTEAFAVNSKSQNRKQFFAAVNSSRAVKRTKAQIKCCFRRRQELELSAINRETGSANEGFLIEARVDCR